MCGILVFVLGHTLELQAMLGEIESALHHLPFKPGLRAVSNLSSCIETGYSTYTSDRTVDPASLPTPTIVTTG